MISGLTEMVRALFGVISRPRENHLVNQVDIAPTRILNNNDKRIGAIIVNNSPNSIWIDPYNDVSSTKGIFLNSNGGQIVLNWDTDLSLVSHEWWATATVDNSEITVIENVIM